MNSVRIKSEKRIEVKLNAQTSGKVKLSSGDEITQKKVCAVSFITDNENQSLSLQPYKLNTFNGSVFLTLYDDKNDRFVLNAPAFLFNPLVYGRVIKFKPRKLHLSNSYITFYEGLSSSRSFGLILHFSE